MLQLDIYLLLAVPTSGEAVSSDNLFFQPLSICLLMLIYVISFLLMIVFS